MVTIIITAYNVSQTIGRAIESCLAQTYKDLEILIVEDCSTDCTLEMIHTYTDPRIRLIQNETNQGAGMSRRIGSKSAKGEYTIFLDGDDYLDNDCVETLYNTALEYKADVVSQGVKVIVNNEVNNILTYNEDLKVCHGSESVDDEAMIKRFLNNKLIKRTIWDKVDYSSRRFVEDTQTCFFVLFFSDTVVNLKYAGYNYVQYPDSLCHTADSGKMVIYQALCAKDICEFIFEHNNKEFGSALQAFIIRLRLVKETLAHYTNYKNFSEELAELFTYFLKFANI